MAQTTEFFPGLTEFFSRETSGEIEEKIQLAHSLQYEYHYFGSWALAYLFPSPSSLSARVPEPSAFSLLSQFVCPSHLEATDAKSASHNWGTLWQGKEWIFVTTLTSENSVSNRKYYSQYYRPAVHWSSASESDCISKSYPFLFFHQQWQSN